MATNFNYTAKDNSGNTQQGVIVAASKNAALSALQEKNLKPLVVKEASKDWKNIEIKLPGNDKVKTQDLVMFTRQFSTMVNAGVSLVRCLNTLRDQTESEGLKKVLTQVVSDVEAGEQISDAMAKHPKVFSSVYVNMVKAGEEGGILDQIMERLATQVEKDSEIKGQVKGAMTYPAVILGITVIAFLAIMIFIIPELTDIFDDLDGELPILTQVIIGISDALRDNFILVLIGIAVVIFGFIRFIKTERGKFLFDKTILKMPIIGPIVQKINVARFSRTFSSLNGAGVSVIQSLEVTAGALSNTLIQQGIHQSIDGIKQGEPIADAIAATEIFPPIVNQMAAIGEETGQIDTVLNKVAEFYEKEVDRVISSLTSIIEPLLIVVLGGVVGTIVASVFGPIMTLTESF